MSLEGESEVRQERVDHRKNGGQHGRIKAVNDGADRGILGRERAGGVYGARRRHRALRTHQQISINLIFGVLFLHLFISRHK